MLLIPEASDAVAVSVMLVVFVRPVVGEWDTDTVGEVKSTTEPVFLVSMLIPCCVSNAVSWVSGLVTQMFPPDSEHLRL